MIDCTGCHHEHPVAGVVASEIAADLLRREAEHGFRRAEDGASQRLVAIGDFREFVEYDVVRHVVGSVDFLQDNLLFAL